MSEGIVSTTAPRYWEERAERYATYGSGLAAVCSYGMPEFHNLAIDLTQRRALAGAFASLDPGCDVLDVGCGIGRWSRRLARRGHRVLGSDLSAVMIREAESRAKAESLDELCSFTTADLTSLELGRTFDAVIGVTVLQHIVDDDAVSRAVLNIRRHLSPGGRAILLEAAPTRPSGRCDSGVFRARTDSDYLRLFEEAGLEAVSVTGADPMPLRTLYLPLHRRLPPAVARFLLLMLTGFSLPVDLAVGPRLGVRSWHKVFVLRAQKRDEN